MTPCNMNRCNGHGTCQGNTCACSSGWRSAGANQEGLIVGPPPSSNRKFCTIDPCEGCPANECDARTGFCACSTGTFAGINRKVRNI
jgi:hypothetical protein